MVAWEPGHGGLAAAASGATRRGSRAPGAPDRGSRQRIDGSQLAHSATQDGAEAKTVVVASRRWRESRGLAAWLHRAGTRGRTIDRRRDDGEEVEEAEIPTGQPPTSLATEATTNLHLRPQRRSNIHLQPHATLLERRTGID